MSWSALWQQFFPARPTFTEKDVRPGSQVGKVFIITGGHSGIGLALLKMLYPTGATIYLAGRSSARMNQAIQDVVTESKSSSTSTSTSRTETETPTPARLETLHLDIADLTTVQPAAAAFASRESRLDVLWNNAGVGCAPDSLTKQGLEAHAGANCVAPLLFAQSLLPLLTATAQLPDTPPASVRIVWTGSLHIDMTAPRGGIDFARIDSPPRPEDVSSRVDYAASKAGNWFLAAEAARRWGRRSGVVSVCQNPGNLFTGFYDNESWLLMLFLKTFVLYETRYGAYTMLFAGLSPSVGEGDNGAYIWPWGRIRPVARPDVLKEGAEEGGKATAFWEWCQRAWEKHI